MKWSPGHLDFKTDSDMKVPIRNYQVGTNMQDNLLSVSLMTNAHSRSHTYPHQHTPQHTTHTHTTHTHTPPHAMLPTPIYRTPFTPLIPY